MRLILMKSTFQRSERNYIVYVYVNVIYFACYIGNYIHESRRDSTEKVINELELRQASEINWNENYFWDVEGFL